MQIHTSEDWQKKISFKFFWNAGRQAASPALRRPQSVQNPPNGDRNRSLDLSLPTCIHNHWATWTVWPSTSILGYISSRWPTWRTVANIFWSCGFPDNAFSNASLLANVWRTCRPSLRTNAEFWTSCYAQIALHENLGQNLGLSLGIDSLLSICWKCMEKHNILCVLLCV